MAPPVRPIPPLPELSIVAYTAGLVDGEGSIQINPTKSQAGKKYWGLTVQICSSAEGFLEPLRELWGGIGTLTYWHSRGSRKHRRSCNWRFYSAQAGWFLSVLMPHLRLKKEQASVALEFRKYVSPIPYSLTPELLEHRGRLAQQMRTLNQRTGKALASATSSAL